MTSVQKRQDSKKKQAQPSSIQGVPLLDLARQHGPLLEEFTESLAAVCRSGQFVLGPEVVRLEQSVAEYSQAKHAVGCASGSDALLLALMACGVGPADEVILPSFTFFATASAVTRLGATPVFADIEPETFNICPASIEALINPATKAIIPVHLFGQCADMDRIGEIATESKLTVIEDAAQAIGAEFAGSRAGSIGHIGCFSFYPTKNLGGAGDAGMLTTNDDELADKLQLLRGHGMRPRYYHNEVGANSRLDSFQAAVLNVKLPYLDRWSQMRQENAARYTELFKIAGLEELVGLPPTAPNRRHVWNQYVIRVRDDRRDALREHLAAAKIGSEIYYPLGLHQQECFDYLGYSFGDLPQTELAAGEVLALPIFPELTAKEQEIVVARIAAFLKPSTDGHAIGGPKFLKHTPTGKNKTTPSRN
ncbi:MAG: DegT/DnrJ/EryC1/StrS family aminotransferase [Planctomycetota bacterium]|nr:DegT/DnrJ/EryC1/StrS family aminotransferase [Planctomycetota bacterium]